MNSEHNIGDFTIICTCSCTFRCGSSPDCRRFWRGSRGGSSGSGTGAGAGGRDHHAPAARVTSETGYTIAQVPALSVAAHF